jgi:hypothetical protein
LYPLRENGEKVLSGGHSSTRAWWALGKQGCYNNEKHRLIVPSLLRARDKLNKVKGLQSFLLWV